MTEIKVYEGTGLNLDIGIPASEQNQVVSAVTGIPVAGRMEIGYQLDADEFDKYIAWIADSFCGCNLGLIVKTDG
jgi:hypothetical protein